MDKNTRDKEYCLGYGFAVCQAKEDMDALLAQANQIRYKGRYITLREYKVGSKLKEDKKQFNQRRLFIGNVPQNIKALELREVFAKYGRIENIYFVDQSVQQNYKYGYVVFHDESSANKVLNEKVTICVGNTRLRVESFGGKKASSQISSKDQTNANTYTNTNLRDRTIGNPSADSLGVYGIEPTPQISTALGPTASGPAQLLKSSKFKLMPESDEQSEVAQADGSNEWRKLLFKKNKTFSLESSPFFQAACDGESNKFSMADQNLFKQNQVALQKCGELQQPSRGFRSPIHPKAHFDYFTGRRYLSDEQTFMVAASHRLSNLRMNIKKKRVGMVRPI